MKKQLLTIIIGGDADKDEQALWDNPKKASMEQPQNALYLDSYEQLNKVLSPARLDLLRYLIKNKHSKQQKPVGIIAKELNRKQEAISRDLHYLHGLKYIDLRKEKQTVYASTQFEDIDIQMQEA